MFTCWRVDLLERIGGTRLRAIKSWRRKVIKLKVNNNNNKWATNVIVIVSACPGIIEVKKTSFM